MKKKVPVAWFPRPVTMLKFIVNGAGREKPSLVLVAFFVMIKVM